MCDTMELYGTNEVISGFGYTGNTCCGISSLLLAFSWDLLTIRKYEISPDLPFILLCNFVMGNGTTILF